MRLKDIAAIPHPDGNRIDLYWVNPDPVNYPGIRIVRRTGTHPISPEDGVIVTDGDDDLDFTTNAQGERHYRIKDSPLKGETVYYYAWFPYPDEPPVYAIDPANRAIAMATSPYGMAGQMAELLPAIYHRYDASLAQAGDAEGKPGPLRRFLDLPGGQLDQLYSYARALLDLYDPGRVDGRLLPLLAQWIGWQTDYRRDIDGQRNEIRNAPYLYQTIGIIPTVEATVKRIMGWESRTKEFVHNVALSNRPERLNLWVWRHDTSIGRDTVKLLSLDFAYEGRAATVRDGSGVVWLFYHTLRADRWEIWYKTLSGGPPAEGDSWSPSQPLSSDQYLNRHPAAVFHGDQLWVFWDAYDLQNKTWRLHYQTRKSGGAWSVIASFGKSERRAPVAAVDQSGGLWLFWLEKTNSGWQLNYNRYDGKVWGSPYRFPPDGSTDSRVESDVFVLFHPTDQKRKLWVFWARKEQLDKSAQTRWRIACRFKEEINLDDKGWSAIATLPKEQVEADADDREPAAWVNKDDQIELFWSSTRDGSWSIWHTALDTGTPTPLTGTPYSQRAPLPLPLADNLLLLYRSSESLPYTSTVYTATETLDTRYAGCTTVDARNAAKIALRRQFKDFQTYTYETGRDGKRGDQDWYGRDTVGIYLTPTIEDPAVIREKRRGIKDVLKQFLPIQVRTIFVIEPAVCTEAVYTYEFPTAVAPRLIAEAAIDHINTVIADTYGGLIESRCDDTVPAWIRAHSWSSVYPDHHTVDFKQILITTSFRTWHTGLATGG